MTKIDKFIKLVLMLILTIMLILVIPIGFYNSLVDKNALGSSVIFLILPVIVTIGVGIFILHKIFKRKR